jgi:Fe-S oxidoreductase
MKRWVVLMAQHGGMPIIKDNEDFFQWLRDKLIMVEDYAYVETDFHGDPDLALPEGSQWEDIGKIFFFIICCFSYFNYKMFFSFIQD